MQPCGQEYWSMANNKDIAALTKGASLPESSNLVTDVPNWTVSEYCTRYDQVLVARRLTGMFSEGLSKTVDDRRNMWPGTDIGAYERGWSLMRQCRASTFGQAAWYAVIPSCRRSCVCSSVVRIDSEVPR